MYLTQQTDYALRVLAYAAANSEELVNIATIAEVYGISRSHLMKVATALVKGGFLDSVRGKGGGLRLSRSAEGIVIGDVVRHIEPMKLVECMGADNHCLLIDLRSKFPELTGKVAEKALVAADITVNKNMVPYDSRSAFQTSGIRVGTHHARRQGGQDGLHRIAHRPRALRP